MPTSLGPAEILVILVVALIVLGPERLPKAARQIGKAVGEIRHWSGGIQDEVRNAFNADEVRNSFNPDPDPQPSSTSWSSPSSEPSSPPASPPTAPPSPASPAAPGPGSFGGARTPDVAAAPDGPTPN